MIASACWAIDVGQTALKALRCSSGPLANGAPALQLEAFDYIEYPQQLSDPAADPQALLTAAIETLLSRNVLRGQPLAFSLPGQAALLRFIKPPPVERSKMRAIIELEARQQVPFPLEEVAWDWQLLYGQAEPGGFLLDSEALIAAYKLDGILHSLTPWTQRGLRPSVVQIEPLSVWNWLLAEQFPGPPPLNYESDAARDFIGVVALGTESSTLLLSDGVRLWTRTIPLGGSHFTRVLTKELKLTFAKAEHLKRNASKADDPKAVFQAMRPVFNDLTTEVQRSLGFFSSIYRRANLRGLRLVGGPTKLPGVHPYLEKQLGLPIERVEQFKSCTGDAVLSAPAFQENLSSFVTCVGLARQALGQARATTNLLPPSLRPRGVKHALGRFDDFLQTLSGDENQILHYYLRGVAAGLVTCSVAGVGKVALNLFTQ